MGRRGNERMWRALLRAGGGTIGVMFAAAVAAGSLAAKDIGPANPLCDGFDKTGEAWAGCARSAASTDAERFYAGYWLAKTGNYRAALAQLEAIAAPDVRTLTYIGFSYRKLGAMDRAFAHYARALGSDPDFAVARAYLGEAYLTLGDRGRAVGELGEIAARCGRQCPEYADLAGHIADFDRRNSHLSPG